MEGSDQHYVHGTDPEEQRRLSRLNALLNASSLGALDLRGGERLLDVGSGLGQFSRMLARKAGPTGRVVAVERSEEQLAEARRQARKEGEEGLLDFRCGDAVQLPLGYDEWGGFDVAHARFLLEHVRDPLAVVRSMVRAVRPGGRVVVEDDDHDLLRMWPEPPEVLKLWQDYFETYRLRGKDPHVGRRLIALLHEAGARPRSNRSLFFGSCAGSANFEAMVDNFIGVIDGARDELLEFGLADGDRVDAAIEAFQVWRRRPDAALWYTTCWAEGIRGGGENDRPEAEAGNEAAGSESAPGLRGAGPARGRADEASLLRFLMDAAAELNSTLELEKVFHKIATGIRPLIDYHLFCVGLWNERTQMLEHSFSMKYGRVIPQRGGFPLGYGLSGTAAAQRKPIRVADVLQDSRYVRFRHPEVEIHSELAVPLVFKDQLIGVLDLESTEPDYFTEEQEQMLSALAAHIATALVNARLFEKTLRDEQRLERDLATAREIQRGLLPESTPRVDRLEIGASTTPARELGGDFYDYLHYADGRLAIAVGDVAGKATPAALLGSMAVGLLRGHVVEDPHEPAEMLAELNQHLLGAGGDSRFVAMVYAVYDDAAGRLTLANGGFPWPLHLRGGEMREVRIGGRPLGLLPDSTYRTHELRVEPGDMVVFCSDGLMESENERGEPFHPTLLGAELRRLAERPAGEIADGLSRGALEFAGGPARQWDDYTAVVLKFS